MMQLLWVVLLSSRFHQPMWRPASSCFAGEAQSIGVMEYLRPSRVLMKILELQL